MDPIVVGVGAFALLMVIVFLGVPIAFAMLATACAGFFMIGYPSFAGNQLVSTFISVGTDFSLIAIPLYFLMGQLVQATRIADDLFEFVYRWLGRLPGGVAISSVVACGGFGAVSGGSVTAVATIAPMSIPAMRRYGYNDALATGSVSAGATLGILIPPSVIMIGYGVLTETSIGALFLAGIVPGILLMVLFAVTIMVICLVRPGLGPRGKRFTFSEKMQVLGGVLPVLLVFATVIGGIYLGIFTPTEAAGVGVLALLIVSTITGKMSWSTLRNALRQTVHLSAMIYLIIVGGHMMAKFVAMTGLADAISAAVLGLGFSPIGTLLLLAVVLIILGMVLDVWGMMILTVPFMVPIVVNLDYSLVWFGIFFVIMAELALITPPIGINVYVMAKFVPDVKLFTIFYGVLPFVLITLVFVVILILFPQLALWLPTLSRGG